MANTGNSDKWYFTKDELENTPSRQCGYDSHKELSHRQQAANFIQDMGQRLKVSQLCINTAIVYMHRFYVFHSFTSFPWHQMASAALFLAAKVEEQPRKLEHVIRVANLCRNPRDTPCDVNSDRYLLQSQDLVFNENVLLQTLGFDVAIDHPHTHVVRCCHLVRASKDLAQTSYFMASNSLHLTTMCLQYKPTVVACFCILVACKWSNWEIPLSNEKKEWFSYVDPTVTAELLQQLTEEFLVIFGSCSSRLKEKIMAIAEVAHTPSPHMNSPFDTDPKKIIREDGKDQHMHRLVVHDVKTEDPHKHRSSRPHDQSSSSSQQQREREYRDKKERERLSQQHNQKLISGSSKPMTHGHHRPPVDPKLKQHSRPPSSSSSGYPPTSSNRTVEPRDILREAARESPFGLANKDYRDSSRSSSDLRDLGRNNASEKDKRDYLLKSNVAESTNYLDNRLSYNVEKQRMDASRSRGMDMSKAPPGSGKHDIRRHDDPSKSYLKSSDPDNTKKHLSATNSSNSSSSSVHDKISNNSVYLNKFSNSTSLKVKSPSSLQIAPDTSKSVPTLNHQISSNSVPVSNKSHHHNGNNSSSNGCNMYNVPQYHHHDYNVDKIKQEIKEEVISPPIVKRPSMFSPEKSPTPPMVNKKASKSPKWTGSGDSGYGKLPTESPDRRRSRNYSSGSEPELRPVMKKIDQVEGFENLMRDSTIGGVNKLHQIPDIITPIPDIKKEKVKEGSAPNYSKEMKPPDIIPPISCDNSSSIGSAVPQPQHSNSAIVNGIETDPTLISNLLKEAPTVAHLSTVGRGGMLSNKNNTIDEGIIVKVEEPEIQLQSQIEITKEKDHHHHKSKKKNKDKHKHKDKSREDREKKKKHKDKDRERHKHRDKQQPEIIEHLMTEPIKIKIHKDKIQPVSDNHMTASSSNSATISSCGPTQGIALKIKIPKDKIKTESGELPIQQPTLQSHSGGGLKIKIPKDVIKNCNTNSESSSRKRERDRSSSSSMDHQPPTKISKSSFKESKQNGRHPHKVAQMGDGDTSLHRLAESKYLNKNSSS